MTERKLSLTDRETAPTDRATDILLAPLTHGPVGLPSPFDEAQARARHLPWLEAQVSALPRERLDVQSRASSTMARKRLKWTAMSVAALAAGTLLVLGNSLIFSPPSGASAAHPLSGPSPSDNADGYATLVSGHVISGSVEVLAGSRLGMSSRLVTGQKDGAVLRGSSGFVVALGPATNFSLLADAADGSGRDSAHPPQIDNNPVAKRARLKQESSKDTRLLLSEGTASFDVPPLALGSSLKVLTSDAEVKVIGTRFTVSVTEQRATCVRVMEGEVLVTSRGVARSVIAGQAWGCSSDQADAGSPSSAAPPSKNRDVTTGRATADNLQKKTTLAEENALLSRALSQESQGQDRAAATAYKELLRRFPGSPFAPEARAGLLRVDVRAP